jgi:hypothetical protein
VLFLWRNPLVVIPGERPSDLEKRSRGCRHDRAGEPAGSVLWANMGDLDAIGEPTRNRRNAGKTRGLQLIGCKPGVIHFRCISKEELATISLRLLLFVFNDMAFCYRSKNRTENRGKKVSWETGFRIIF